VTFSNDRAGNLNAPLSPEAAEFLGFNLESLAGLAAWADLSEGFTLGFVECGSQREVDWVIDALRRHPLTVDVQIESIALDDPDLKSLCSALVEIVPTIDLISGQELVLVVTGLERAIGIVGEYTSFVSTLNFERDILAKRVPYPVIVVLPDYAMTRVARYAVDFWAWSSGRFRFVRGAGAMAAMRSEVFDPSGRLSSEMAPVKQERLELLAQLLMDCAPSGREVTDVGYCLSILLELADGHSSLGKRATARLYYQQALDLAQEHHERKSEAQALLRLGIALPWQDNAVQAKGYYDRALAIYLELDDRSGEANASYSIGNVLELQGKWDEALSQYKVAIEIYRQLESRSGEAIMLNAIGSVYNSQGKWEAAIDCYQQSLETMRAIGNQQGIAQIMNNLGSVYKDRGKWAEAIDCYQQSLAISHAIGDQQGIAQTINNLGLIYGNQGKWEEAIDCYQKSLAISRAIGDQQSIAQTMNNLGLIYGDQGKWKKAIDCYQQSLEISHAIGNQQGIAQTMNNLGNVYKDRGKWAEAIDCCQQSLAISRVIGNQQGIAQTMNNLGLICKDQRKWAEAIDCYQQSLEISHAIGDPQGLAQTWFNLGNAQSQLGQLAARTSYQNAKALYQQLKLTDWVQNCDNAIATIGQSTRPETLTRAPKIGDDRTPRKKKQQFPLWQSAIVLLLLGIGWMAMKPHAPASQNGEVRMSK
jgi:tetratricopeptide (TPR) repeat protein